MGRGVSIESKLAYRKTFLQSEEWKDVRYAKMARDGSSCDICGLSDLSNDAHHVHYPKRWKDTSVGDLVILCRDCHATIHLFPNTRRSLRQSDSWRHYVSVREKVLAHRKIMRERSMIGSMPINDAREKFKDLKGRLFKAASLFRLRTSLSAPRYLRLILEGKEAERLQIKPPIDNLKTSE